MKKQLTLILLIISIFSCQKSKVTPLSPVENAPITKPNYVRTDTTKFAFRVNAIKNSKLKIQGNPSAVSINLTYLGSNQYRVSAQVNDINYGVQVVFFNLYGPSGLVGPINPSPNYTGGGIYDTGTYSATFTLTAPGNYRVVALVSNNGNQTQYYLYSTYVAIVTPSSPPSGMNNLYEYFNSNYSAHFYTTDWEELGSASEGYVFIKVVGYVYPPSTPGYANLYRYYSPVYADHYYTTNYSTYPMYNYEWVQCAIATSPTGTMTGALNEYYNDALADHFYCLAPETPTGTGWWFSKTVGYIQQP